MVIRVLKKGPGPKVVKKVIVCGHCGATLEYIPSDVQSYSGTDYSGGTDGKEWINCPQCKTEVTIRSW